MADPARPDEVVIDQNMRRQFELAHRLDDDARRSTVSPRDIAQRPPGMVPHGVDPNFRQKLRVVGIAKSVDSEPNWTPSARLLRQVRRPDSSGS